VLQAPTHPKWPVHIAKTVPQAFRQPGILLLVPSALQEVILLQKVIIAAIAEQAGIRLMMDPHFALSVMPGHTIRSVVHRLAQFVWEVLLPVAGDYLLA
jgi:hypothetical protein